MKGDRSTTTFRQKNFGSASGYLTYCNKVIDCGGDVVKFEEPTAGRQLLAWTGIYLIVLGIAFGITAAKFGLRVNQRVPMLMLIIGGAREFVLGIIVVFCAYRFR